MQKREKDARNKSRQKSPTQPPRIEETKKENAARGTPPTQKKKNTRPKERRKIDKFAWGSHALVKAFHKKLSSGIASLYSLSRRGGQRRASRVNSNKQHNPPPPKKTKHSSLSCRPPLVIKKDVIVAMHPPPQRGPQKPGKETRNMA